MALANKLKLEYAIDSLFIVSDEESAGMFKNSNFSFINLQCDYRDYSDKSAKHLLEMIINEDIDSILIDSYYIKNAYVEILRKNVKVACFYYMTRKISVDVLINYNVDYDIEFYKKNYISASSKLLLGTKYVPIRDEFRSVCYQCRPHVERILVLTGGSDPFHITDLFLEESGKFDKITWNIVVGRYSEFVLQKQVPKNVKIVYNTHQMASLMLENDLVISAAGTTMYEICAIGIPAIIFSMADNQCSEPKYLEKMGCIKYIGDVRENHFDLAVEKSLRVMMNSFSKRQSMSKKMRFVVDGAGCCRIASILNNMINTPLYNFINDTHVS
ncbi:MAG: hypothetical protein MSH21_11610 [Clostridium sp.]|nr:hypothetical protein [Clostridium sp.]